MSFGSGPFGLSALGVPIQVLAEETPSAVHSSRKIDPQTRTFVANDEGGYEGMDDVAHTAFLLLLTKFGPRPQFVSSASEEEIRQRAREALKPLTRGKEPKMRILEIPVSATAAGTLRFQVAYQNLLTGTMSSVEP